MKFKELVASIVFLLVSVTNSFGQSGDIQLSYTQPKTYEIGDITFGGVRYLDNEALIAILGFEIGDEVKIPGDQISNAINKLWEQKIVSDIKVAAQLMENGKLQLHFELKERNRLSRYFFNGIKKGQATDLKEDIGLIRGKVVTDALIRNAELNIKQFYKEKGFLNVAVKTRKKRDSTLSNSIAIDFYIENISFF